MRLILYSKPGCHLCEGLLEKLEQIKRLTFALEVRDINTDETWFQAYQYEIPVLYAVPDQDNGNQASAAIRLPRVSPRASVQQVEQMLQKYLGENSSE